MIWPTEYRFEDDGSHFEYWMEARRPDLEADFLSEMSDEFEEFCRKRYERAQGERDDDDDDDR